MKQRRWIIETTGEDRPPQIGEYYFNELQNKYPESSLVLRATFAMQADWPILRVIEVCLDHSLPLPCGDCAEIEEEYRWRTNTAKGMSENKNMGD